MRRVGLIPGESTEKIVKIPVKKIPVKKIDGETIVVGVHHEV